MELLSPSIGLTLWSIINVAILILIVWVVVKLIKVYAKKQSIKKV
jgi:hypothetical protein